ncbi:MAG: hypothetical protein KGZ25_04600, partial [Planctomycetes bacterium]|nr:hypothetical protein [Planctomycetota bacterium]
ELENALLLTGKMRYMDVLRKQIRRLYENKVEINGKKYPPSHYDSNGWNGKGRYHRSLTRLFLAQFRPEDMKLIEEDLQRRGKHKFSYRTGFFYHVDDYAWLFFVLGKNPEFPRRMFESDIKRIRHRVEQMKRDNSEDWKRRSDHAQRFHPVSTHTLVNLTCGSIGPLWQSTPILAEAWHYDPTEARPGLPPDVGALVNSITKQGFGLQLVNLSQTQKRKIVVQTGAYGENKCIRVNFRGKKYAVDNHYFVVELGAGCGGKLQVEVDRFANQPTAGLPWEK